MSLGLIPPIFSALQGMGKMRQKVFTSSTTWTVPANIINGSCTATLVAGGGGGGAGAVSLNLMLVGSSSGARHTANVTNWNNRTLGGSVAVSTMAYGPNILVEITSAGVQQPGSLYTSTDNGVTWTSRQLYAAQNLGRPVDVCYGNGKFAAVGLDQDSSCYAYTSTDGITWGVTLLPACPMGGMLKIRYENGQFVAVGNEGYIMFGTDGTTYSCKQEGSAAWRAVCWAPSASLWVIGGNAGVIKTSTTINGTYTVRTSQFGTSGVYGLTANSSIIVAVGAGGKISTSTDGITWTARTSGTALDLLDVVWTGGKFVAAGMSGAVVTSTDGITWSLVDVGASSINFVDIAMQPFTSIGFGGDGGAAGQSLVDVPLTVTPGANLAITVGAAGTGATGAQSSGSTGTNGTSGGSSSIGSLVSVQGGSGGAGGGRQGSTTAPAFFGMAKGGEVPITSSTSTGIGAQGGTQGSQASGYKGGNGTTDGGYVSGGSGAGSLLGVGGNGAPSAASLGNSGGAAIGYGSGGGGGCGHTNPSTPGNGGNGAPGVVVVTWMEA